MRIKKFTAGSMREALVQIKNELGEEAIILKTRKLPKKVFALGAKDGVEVTAAIDEAAPSRPALPPIAMQSTGVYPRPRTASNIIDPDQVEAQQVKTWVPPREDGVKIIDDERMASAPRRTEDRRDQLQMLELKENIRELREMVKGILKNGSSAVADEFTGGWAVLYRRLIESEVKPDIAKELLKKISATDLMLSDSKAEKKFTSALASTLAVAGPLKLKKEGPLVVAFIGPTGNGKTTTLAKLAAHCRINKDKRVSIITADTYRIAAIEQIRIFVDIIKVGLQVIFSPREAPAALEECASDDIVLIDTAGRSQRNHEHMDDLRELMAVLHPDEVHLVLSATTKDSDLLDCIGRYKGVGVNRLLFTKLDETGRIGNLFNVVHKSNLPVSYFTTGQSVPDDIEVAQISRLIQRLLEGSVL
jgi:flagellar biosynthesis protein FlhF